MSILDIALEIRCGIYIFYTEIVGVGAVITVPHRTAATFGAVRYLHLSQTLHKTSRRLRRYDCTRLILALARTIVIIKYNTMIQ